MLERERKFHLLHSSTTHLIGRKKAELHAIFTRAIHRCVDRYWKYTKHLVYRRATSTLLQTLLVFLVLK
jgi:hypothetical protein